MNSLERTAIGTVAILLLSACPEARSEPYTEEDHGRAGFQLFLRPKHATPHDQFTHAESLLEADRLKQADRAYRALTKSWPSSLEAVTSQLRHVEILRRKGKLEKAFEASQMLVDKYTGRFDYQMVLQEQFEIALAIMEARRGKVLFYKGFKTPERAIKCMKTVVKNGPRWKHAPEAQFLIGHIYEQNKKYDLAITAYLECMLRYPQSAYTEESAFARARCLVALSNRNPYDQEVAQEAWHALTGFSSTYPASSDQTKTAKELSHTIHSRLAKSAYDIAVFYDQKARKSQAALIAYRLFVTRYPTSPWTEKAQKRIKILGNVVETQDEQ